MASRHRYCRCGTQLAADNPGRQCARCDRSSREKFTAPPLVPPEFWETGQFREAFAAQHIGRIARAFRMHPYHYAVYGPSGISQTLLGQWLGLGQAQVSRVETGPPIRHFDTLRHWVQVLRIPPRLLWFRLPEDNGELILTDSEHDTGDEHADDPEHDPVLSAPWSHRGTVEVSLILRGGDRPVKRRGFVFLSGMALTAPAHQWLIQEPGPLVSGLSGRRVSTALADRFMAMIPELRMMDDVAGGGTVFALAEHDFGMIAGLLDQASYDEPTGRKLHLALAELGQLAGWAAYDAGRQGLAQRYYIAGLRAAHSANDRRLGAHILGEMAYQATTEGHPQEAVTLIDTAVAGVRGRETASLLIALYSKQAYAFATLGDSASCMAAISKTHTHLEHLNHDEDPPYLYWVRPVEVTYGAGRALLKLGRADQAAAMLEDGVALFDESFVRDRRNCLIRLAEALVQPGPQRDLDAAAEHGRAALDLSENLDSTRGVGRIRDLYHQMKPHAKVPAVGDFLEQTRGFMAI